MDPAAPKKYQDSAESHLDVTDCVHDLFRLLEVVTPDILERGKHRQAPERRFIAEGGHVLEFRCVAFELFQREAGGVSGRLERGAEFRFRLLLHRVCVHGAGKKRLERAKGFCDSGR